MHSERPAPPHPNPLPAGERERTEVVAARSGLSSNAGVGAPSQPVTGQSVFVTAHDGLRLHAREYGPRRASALPVVCLPGLARTARDFDGLAAALANDPDRPRRVIAMDYRGRGLSEYDRNPLNYTLTTELADVLAVLTARSFGPAVFIGTSRGGLITMLLAAAQPARIAGVVLNDIGPVLETQGLLRIKSYVGKLPQPRNYAEAAEILQRLFDQQFPKLTAEDWQQWAQLNWREEHGRLILNYDARLSRVLEAIDAERGMPSLWPQFDALGGMPLLVIRGELSDLLSAATVEEMRKRRKKTEVIDVPAEGHPPLLGTPEMIRRIRTFIEGCDRAAHHT
jgi:pimeloyl-ACP methyl ester carboxylesterase